MDGEHSFFKLQKSEKLTGEQAGRKSEGGRVGENSSCFFFLLEAGARCARAPDCTLVMFLAIKCPTTKRRGGPGSLSRKRDRTSCKKMQDRVRTIRIAPDEIIRVSRVQVLHHHLRLRSRTQILSLPTSSSMHGAQLAVKYRTHHCTAQLNV